MQSELKQYTKQKMEIELKKIITELDVITVAIDKKKELEILNNQIIACNFGIEMKEYLTQKLSFDLNKINIKVKKQADLLIQKNKLENLLNQVK
jgi:hypothetical protein